MEEDSLSFEDNRMNSRDFENTESSEDDTDDDDILHDECIRVWTETNENGDSSGSADDSSHEMEEHRIQTKSQRYIYKEIKACQSNLAQCETTASKKHEE